MEKVLGCLKRLKGVASFRAKGASAKIAFAVVMLLGTFARVYMFGSVPGDINQDEAFAGYNAYTLLQHAADSYGYRLPVYLTAWGSGMNALESYLMIPFVALFGMHVWVIRLPMLLVGLMSLVAVYFLVRRFASERIALGATLLLAISPWHVMLSRWALESNLAPGFVLFGLFFFVKGLEKPKFLIASAVFYGLSLYAYATIWVAVPFIVLLNVLYALWTKSIHNNRYTWISLAVLFALALPLLLFMLVNKGVMDEIRLPFISIPKLVYFRASEISFQKIPENFMNLWNILKNQSDGLPWNYIHNFGLFYPVTLAFFFVGLVENIWQAVGDIRARKLGLSFFMLVWLLAAFAIGILISVNVNRVNLIFIPIIVMAAQGIILAFSYIHPKMVYVPLVAYLLSFANFEREYFTKYRDSIASNFCEGIGDAMEFAQKQSKPNDKIYVEPNVSYPRVLFYGKVDLNSYLSTVSYTNFPSAFLYVHHFDRYVFTFDLDKVDTQSVYLMENESGRLSWFEEQGFSVRNFGKYIVAYPAKLL